MLENNTGFTADWWQRRTIKELRELSDAGLSGSGLCEAAALELERRALEERRRQQELSDEAANQKKKRATRGLIIAASVVGILSALAVLAGFLASAGRQATAQHPGPPAVEGGLPQPRR
jgi:cytochrome c-type biogenesis protein CcmH/NrfG